jgi:hypothetical protein
METIVLYDDFHDFLDICVQLVNMLLLVLLTVNVIRIKNKCACK